jgi:polysaccharide biosynthesis protein PslH
MRVLILAPKQCWPPTTGAMLRNYHLARELSRRASVTFLSFTEKALPSSNGHRGPLTTATHDALRDSPERWCERVVAVERGRGYTFGKLLRGALGRTPLPVLNYKTREMEHALARLLDERDFDIVQVETETLTAYMPVMRAARRRPLVVCDWHNIDSEVMWRYGEFTSSAGRRLYARATARRLEEFERRIVRELDGHVVVSQRDRARLLEHAPDARVTVIENGVDVEYYSDERLEQAHAAWLASRARDDAHTRRRRVVFVGSMDYHANVDAVVRFAHETWPNVYSRRPELVFTVVGRDPSAEVRALAELQGVEVTGTVEDVRPYYRDAFAQVVPLRVGGGSRLKILEALAAGVPVVSTTLGAEGLFVTDGEDIRIADTPEELSDALVGLAESADEGRRLAVAGRALVRARYDWSAIGAALFESHERLLKQRDARAV